MESCRGEHYRFRFCVGPFCWRWVGWLFRFWRVGHPCPKRSRTRCLRRQRSLSTACLCSRRSRRPRRIRSAACRAAAPSSPVRARSRSPAAVCTYPFRPRCPGMDRLLGQTTRQHLAFPVRPVALVCRWVSGDRRRGNTPGSKLSKNARAAFGRANVPVCCCSASEREVLIRRKLWKGCF